MAGVTVMGTLVLLKYFGLQEYRPNMNRLMPSRKKSQLEALPRTSMHLLFKTLLLLLLLQPGFESPLHAQECKPIRANRNQVVAMNYVTVTGTSWRSKDGVYRYELAHKDTTEVLVYKGGTLLKFIPMAGGE